MKARLSNARLDALARETADQLAMFTDPPTATAQIRALELQALLAELIERRAAEAGT